MTRTALPAAYAWLDDVIASGQAPRTILEARRRYGVAEVVGPKHNPVIMDWARQLGVERDYKSDEVAWCGLFAGVVVKAAGWEPVKALLGARNWLAYGKAPGVPGLGDVLVFWRGSRKGWQGHVGFYVGEDAEAYHVLGGNQGDRVSIVRIGKDRLLGARRPVWRVLQPAGVRPYFLKAEGGLSGNEA